MTELNDQIVFANGAIFNLAKTAAASISPYPQGRDWRRFHITGAVATAAAAFVDDAQYQHIWQSETALEDGGASVTEETEDLSAWSVAGEIVDLRDGTLLVYMGKPTEKETLQKMLAEAEAVNNILVLGVEG